MTDMLAQAALSLTAFPLSIAVKSSVLVAVALVAVRWMRRAPASMRHLVLASAFAVLLALPLAEVLGPEITVPVGRSAEARPVVLPITVAATADPAPIPPAHEVPTMTAGPGVPGAMSPARLLLTAWAAGTFVCLLPVLLTPWRLQRLRRTARPWTGAERLLQSLGARRAVVVLVHDAVAAPLTCGIVRPAVVLPADAFQWSDRDIQQALIHELEHIRRADWPVHVATRIVCALYWFHPLVWITWRRLGLEAERACDDAVLRVGERTAYAQQLVTLARRRIQAPIPALSMAGHSDLSARVAAVLDDTQARGRLSPARASGVVVAAALLVAAVAPLRAAQIRLPAPGQAADAPAFEVVSIRENTSGDLGENSRRQPGGRITISNFRLRNLIISVYGLQPQQLVGGPDWIDSARYDIVAQASGELAVTEPGTVGPGQLMLQRMLADRFQLTVHTETRELPIYALTVARSDGRLGPQISTAAVDCAVVMGEMLKGARGGGPPPAAPQRPDGGPGCGMRFDGRRMVAGGTSMAALARLLAVPVGRLVDDRTGLAGGFDFDLEFTIDPGAAPPRAPLTPPDANAPSVFTALEEQLGLKLEPTRAPVEVLVIDRVERPTEN